MRGKVLWLGVLTVLVLGLAGCQKKVVLYDGSVAVHKGDELVFRPGNLNQPPDGKEPSYTVVFGEGASIGGVSPCEQQTISGTPTNPAHCTVNKDPTDPPTEYPYSTGPCHHCLVVVVPKD